MSAEAAKVIAIDPEKEMQEQAMSLYEKALMVTVTDQPTFETAGEFGKSLKDLQKKIEDYFAPLKKAAHEAHKAITKKEADELSPVKEAIDIVRKTMNVYLDEQERIRRQEEARLRREADEAARKERERLLAQAVKAEEKGQAEKAEEKLEQAEMVYTAPVTVASAVQTNTVSTSAAKDVEITVVDLKAFIAELVKRDMAPTMIDVKAGALKSWVKANAFENFPGLAIRSTSSVRFK